MSIFRERLLHQILEILEQRLVGHQKSSKLLQMYSAYLMQFRLGNGNESIKRYYNIQPNGAATVGNIELKFSSSELNGHNVSNLQLWQSTNNGIQLERHIPVVDTLLKTISKSNVYLNGR